MKTHRGPSQDPLARAARVGSAVTGAWLLASAFLWHHSGPHFLNDALVGAAALVIALGALYVRPQLRIVNIALGVWLFASLLVLRGGSPGTQINDLIAASLLFGFAVVPRDPESLQSLEPQSSNSAF